ncbi:flavoprotein [Aminobacter sp. AP02]|uniref:flavoprotein n=1 Tax=Aminobacter sp. AP02 TaxID=2135737 RepID=UPI001FE0C4AF|nr:flavoprotein [Aminobacter sp. AP02]
MRTLAALAHGLGDNLLTRAADVTLKEKHRLVVAPREARSMKVISSLCSGWHAWGPSSHRWCRRCIPCRLSSSWCARSPRASSIGPASIQVTRLHDGVRAQNAPLRPGAAASHRTAKARRIQA